MVPVAKLLPPPHSLPNPAQPVQPQPSPLNRHFQTHPPSQIQINLQPQNSTNFKTAGSNRKIPAPAPATPSPPAPNQPAPPPSQAPAPAPSPAASSPSPPTPPSRPATPSAQPRPTKFKTWFQKKKLSVNVAVIKAYYGHNKGLIRAYYGHSKGLIRAQYGHHKGLIWKTFGQNFGTQTLNNFYKP